MKKIVFITLILTAFFCMVSASVWEGSAAVAPAGSLPDEGFYAATNSFPRNTIVDITNLESGRTIRVIVAAGLDTPGLLALVSPEAAASIGLNSRAVGRIRMIQPSDPIAFSREGFGTSGDPDRDPAAAVPAYSADNWPTSETYGDDSVPPPAEDPVIVVIEETPAAAPDDSFIPPPAAADDGVAPDPVPAWVNPSTSPAGSEIAPVPEEIAPLPARVYTETTESAPVQATEIAPLPEQSVAAAPVQQAVQPPAPVQRSAPGGAAVPAQNAAPAPAQQPVRQPPQAVPMVAPLPEKKPDAYTKDPGAYDYKMVPSVDKPPQDIPPVVAPIEKKAAKDSAEKVLPEVVGPVKQSEAPSEAVYVEPVKPVKQPEPRKVERVVIPPEEEVAPIPPKKAADTIPETAPAVASLPPEAVPEIETADDSGPEFSAPMIDTLENGKYYLQLGAFSKAESVEDALAKIGKNYPLAIQAAGSEAKPLYRVLVGPVNLGESGALLQRFKGSGYKDAFVRKGR